MEPSEMDSLIFSGRNQGTPVLEARPLEDLRVVLTALCDSGTHRCPPRQFPLSVGLRELLRRSSHERYGDSLG